MGKAPIEAADAAKLVNRLRRAVNAKTEPRGLQDDITLGRKLATWYGLGMWAPLVWLSVHFSHGQPLTTEQKQQVLALLDAIAARIQEPFDDPPAAGLIPPPPGYEKFPATLAVAIRGFARNIESIVAEQCRDEGVSETAKTVRTPIAKLQTARAACERRIEWLRAAVKYLAPFAKENGVDTQPFADFLYNFERGDAGASYVDGTESALKSLLRKFALESSIAGTRPANKRGPGAPKKNGALEKAVIDDKLTTDEAARRFGKSAGAVRTARSRAKKKDES